MERMAKKDITRGENLAQQIIEQYNPKSVADMQNALKDIFGPMFEAMLKGEMNNHLGYENNDHGSKTTANRRNGYITKEIKTSSGEVEIKVPNKVLGNNTINCMQSGATYGVASQVDGMIERIRKEVGNPHLKVIATGGLARVIVPLCNHEIEVDDLLTLKGLLEVYKKNIE